MGTRCLSISVVRFSGGAAGTALRLGAAGGDPAGAGVGRLVRGSVIPWAPGAYSGPEMPPSFLIRQKWTARKIDAASGMRITCRT